MYSNLHFYRPLKAIAAFTFDLDDTLYDNHPVIMRTERESLAFYSKILNRYASGKVQTGSVYAQNSAPKTQKFVTM